MSDNNENNIDETTVNAVEEPVTENTDAADTSDEAKNSGTEDSASAADSADDGITEEEVGSEADSDETTGEAEKTVTIFPAQQEGAGSFADKLKNLTQKQIICISAIAVVIIAVIIAIIVLATSGKDSGSNVTASSVTAVTKATENASTTTETTTSIPVVEPVTDVSFDELSQVNDDIYAYIYIPGTEIDYPILQSEGKGENYYMTYTVNNYVSWTGAIYTQYTYNSKDFTDKNTIIYGHCATRNINSVMFTQLHYYEDEEFLKTYPYVYIYYGDKQFKYQIFVAADFTDILVPYKYGVNDGASLVQFVQDVKTTYGGVVDDSVTIDENSKIITLCTCTMLPNYDESKRFLVLAKLVEEAVVQK